MKKQEMIHALLDDNNMQNGNPKEADMQEEKLQEMTKDELYEMAKEQDIKGRKPMKKAELVKSLEEIE